MMKIIEVQSSKGLVYINPDYVRSIRYIDGASRIELDGFYVDLALPIEKVAEMIDQDVHHR